VSVALLELPEWMFDPAAGHIQLAQTPAVGCEALRDLQALVQLYQPRSGRDTVIDIQHQSLKSSGVLMQKRQSRAGFIQLKLFRPRSRNPQWQNLPVEIQQTTVRLLAQLLRQHCDRGHASSDKKEARDE
jgi:hypothetical protein